MAAAMLHDVAKTKELSPFPENDYTDEGQYIGHIVLGSEMVAEKVKAIEGFPVHIASQIRHCILAHHGKLEYGSPKVPAIIEAVALNYADDTDAKMQTFTEVLNATQETGWIGYNRFFESNIRKTKLD